MRRPWRVVVAIALLPFWLTSTIRQAPEHWVWRWGSVILLWITVLWLGLVGLVVPATSPPDTLDEVALAETDPPPTRTPKPTRTPAPAEAVADDDDGVAGRPPDGLTVPGGLGDLPPDVSSDVVGAAPALVSDLTIAAEPSRSGYDRGLFGDWIDADGDGCDTRRQVLIDEAVEPPSVGPGCSFSGGRWYSAYDGQATTDPSSFDVDHIVALAEAWDSGAHSWSPSRREAFANDLGYAGSLIAVSASSNRSKSDRDPAEWKPSLQDYWCTYASTWIDVKRRWDLTADQSEADELSRMLNTCDGSGSPATTPPTAPPATPRPTPAPTPPPSTPQPTSSSDCHPSYPDFCIPSPPPDLNCDDFSQEDFTVRYDVADPDPHRLDGDEDGIACES